VQKFRCKEIGAKMQKFGVKNAKLLVKKNQYKKGK